jgi:hypothetical protein
MWRFQAVFVGFGRQHWELVTPYPPTPRLASRQTPTPTPLLKKVSWYPTLVLLHVLNLPEATKKYGIRNHLSPKSEYVEYVAYSRKPFQTCFRSISRRKLLRSFDVTDFHQAEPRGARTAMDSRLGLKQIPAKTGPARVRGPPKAPPKRVGNVWATVTIVREHATSLSVQCNNCGKQLCGGAARIHAVGDKLVYCHEALHMQRKLQQAGYKQEVEKWDTDSDSDPSEDGDLAH